MHISAELFKAMTGCNMVHVPYRGSEIAFPDIISNKVQLIFDNMPSGLAQARAGTVRALGVTSPRRWPDLPNIPAIAETVPGFRTGRLLRHLEADDARGIRQADCRRNQEMAQGGRIRRRFGGLSEIWRLFTLPQAPLPDRSPHCKGSLAPLPAAVLGSLRRGL